MRKLARQIATIITDYRNDDDVNINAEHVITWVKQFDENDRIFLLTELLHILPQSYLSKDEVIVKLKSLLEYLRKTYKQKDIPTFLCKAKFLSCQAEHKSQSHLLTFLYEIILKEYGIDITDENDEDKFWIYIDDVLASGGTFRNNIDALIGNYGFDDFKEANIKLLCIFFFLHNWGWANTKYIFIKKYNKEFVKNIDCHFFSQIENDPRINAYYNPTPMFNNAYPINNGNSNEFDEYLHSLVEADRNENYAYRDKYLPRNETFYSTRANRIRYEHILLRKGIEIINRIANVGRPVRPLGLISPSYKTFGTGSHSFTWRNISNTCPIVFWWETNDWYPLFSVANRGN